MKAGDLLNLLTGENVAIILFLIGIYGLAARRNILKSIISLGIIQAAVILFFLAIRFNPHSQPPIGEVAGAIADPLPQALMITTIVIGVAVTAVALTMFMTLYHRYGTTNWLKVIRKREES